VEIQQQKINYLGLSEKTLNRDVYRIIPFTRLIEIFETSQFTLLSPQKWDDPFENLLFKSPIRVGNVSFSFDANQQRCHGQCWTLKAASDAMWRIYSPDKTCVRIKSTIKLLGESFHAVRKEGTYLFIGKVKYCNPRQLIKHLQSLAQKLSENPEESFARALLFKRNAFDHEDEIRLLCFNFNNAIDGTGGLLKYKIDPHRIIKTVLLDPRAPNELVQVYKHYLKEKIGFQGHFSKSTLYDLPKNLNFQVKANK